MANRCKSNPGPRLIRRTPVVLRLVEVFAHFNAVRLIKRRNAHPSGEACGVTLRTLSQKSGGVRYQVIVRCPVIDSRRVSIHPSATPKSYSRQLLATNCCSDRAGGHVHHFSKFTGGQPLAPHNHPSAPFGFICWPYISSQANIYTIAHMHRRYERLGRCTHGTRSVSNRLVHLEGLRSCSRMRRIAVRWGKRFVVQPVRYFVPGGFSRTACWLPVVPGAVRLNQ